MAKQVLQLGMGDAFDDWLIEKIQVLRKGTVVASGIKKIEQVIVDNLLELSSICLCIFFVIIWMNTVIVEDPDTW